MSNNAVRKKTLDSIVVNEAPVQWNEGGEGFSFYGVDSILFWMKPSLVSILQPLLEELGEDLYSRLIAFEASKGTVEDYNWMVSDGKKFEYGFQVWSRAVMACGWGTFEIQAIDWNTKTAKVTIRNPWELKILACQENRNNIPFLVGKMSGVFTHAFGTNCRAEVSNIQKSPSGEGIVELEVKPNLKTLEQALVELHSETNSSDKSRLQALNNALRRNERRLLDVIATVGDFIWESNSNMEISFATTPVYKILQLPEGSVVGKTWKDLLPSFEYERMTKMLKNLTVEDQFVEGEFFLEQTDGLKNWILLRVKRLLDFSGNHAGYVGSGRNITARKKLEAQVVEQQKNAEYSAKMATLGEMAGGVAHEINTPLATIQMVSQRLNRLGKKGEIDPKILADSTEILLKTTDRISKIVQGLRTFCRDGAGDAFEKVMVSNLVEDTVSLCSERFKLHGIELKVEVMQKDLCFEGRSTQISQVLINLLGNAHDAIIGFDEKWVSISIKDLGQNIEFRVTDSGKGIPASVREKLFQPFFTTKEIGKGTGLGLSISLGIIKDHGGLLTIDSESANTCFVIRLPKQLSARMPEKKA